VERKLVSKMSETRNREAATLDKLIKQVKILLPIPQYNVFSAPPELEFVGQGVFKIVFKHGEKAIKYFKFQRISEKDVEKFTKLATLKSFERFYLYGERWIATDFVKGNRLRKRGKNDCLALSAVERLKEDMYACLELGWSPNDLHFGNFIVEPSGRIRCVDVDLFKDIREFNAKKKAGAIESATARIETLYKKLLKLVQQNVQ
jgi:hypothetical protein